MERAPVTPGTPEAISYLKHCGVDHILASSIKSLKAQTPEELSYGNDEIAQSAREYSNFIEPSCQVNPSFGSSALNELKRCREDLNMVCLGEICGYLGNFNYDTRIFGDLIELATQLGMMIQIHNSDVEDMNRLCRIFPETIFLLAHLGKDPVEIDRQIRLTERHPNLYLDISGQGYQRMGIIEKAVQIAGADRAIFGSDFVLNDPAAVIARIRCSSMEIAIQEKILGGNIVRLLSGLRAKQK